MKVRKGSLSEFILIALEKTIDGYARFDDFVNNSKLYALGNGRRLRKSDLSFTIKRLRERGLVDTGVSEGEIIVKLTDLGSEAIFANSDKEWDGKHRIIIYDIPENRRAIRDAFRRSLKSWQFQRWQQSIWITKLDVTVELRKLISKLGIEEWVVVIESDDPAIATLTSRP